MTDYYSESNPPEYEKIPPFRFVKPYFHCYKTIAKGRWLKQKLIDAMVKEFKAYDKEYYLNAISQERILINGKPTSPDYIIQNSDVIVHNAFRNEPPILDVPVQIIHDDEEFLVVYKPPSMIVHTGGGYHFNTLMGILYYEHGYRNLHILHRLDRLTSGLILFAKNKSLATRFHSALGKCTIGKQYLARVQGNFPDDIKTNDRQIYCVSMKDAIFDCCNDDEAQKLNAKPACTHFKKLWYDELTDSSLVECTPITGKTHQIRVHLKDLGFPILNDIGYGGRMVGNKILDEHFKDLDFKKIKQKIHQHQKENQEDEEAHDKTMKRIKQEGEEYSKVQVQEDQEDKISAFKVYEWDYNQHPLEIYLHSFRYQFEDKIFESPQPHWSILQKL